jgi:hypothetical protein
MIYYLQEATMNYLKNLKEQFTFDQLLLIFTCFSFTFPFYILGPILLIEFIYLLVSKKAIIALKQTPQIKFLYLFVLISLSISIIHKNILGALATLGIFIVIILMVYYRKHINKSTFEFIIDIPYNLYTPITYKEQCDIINSARKLCNKLVLVSYEQMDQEIKQAGFEIRNRILRKKTEFVKFGRYIYVCY